jgi:uncharacterized protein (TIGR03083 family)
MTTSPHAPTPDEPVDPTGGASGTPMDTDVALYAIGALDDAELRTVETILASDAASAALESRLRNAAGAMAAASAVDTAPPPALRDRVLAAAIAERPATPTGLVPLAPAELHRIEGERLIDLLRSLSPSDWTVPVDPPEFTGWTVGDLVAHLATVEAFFAQELGIAAPAAPEQQTVNEDRTVAAIERHRRRLTPAAAIAELESFLDAVDTHVDRLTDPSTAPVRWWGGDERTVDQILVVRSFELWIHARDVARAVGTAEPVPSAPSLRTMSTLAAALTPVMCERAGTVPTDALDRSVRFELTGPGGAAHDVALRRGRSSAQAAEPSTTVTIDIVDYCLAVANRIGTDGVRYRHGGDADLAAAVVAALPVLATL